MAFSDEDNIQDNSELCVVAPSSTPTTAKKRRNSDISEVQTHVNTDTNDLKNISNRLPTEVDEVDLFCQLLAKKIKKFDETQRVIIMHDIDELIYHKRKVSL